MLNWAFMHDNVRIHFSESNMYTYVGENKNDDPSTKINYNTIYNNGLKDMSH